LLFVLFYVLFACKCVLPSGDNATAVNKYTISKLIFTHTNTHKSNDFRCCFKSYRQTQENVTNVYELKLVGEKVLCITS
jgi:hypothetical protein